MSSQSHAIASLPPAKEYSIPIKYVDICFISGLDIVAKKKQKVLEKTNGLLSLIKIRTT
jgi:hypothetical protein